MNELNERIAIALERIADSLEKTKVPSAPKTSMCRYCGAEIKWGKYGKKMFPLNMDETAHHCKEYEDAKRAKPA